MRRESRGSILIADDDNTFRTVLADHLEMRGFSVQVASTAEETTKQLSLRSCDVLLLDQNLPDGDGVTLAQQLLESSRVSKIILVTAYADVTRAVKAMRAGVFDYVPKPIDLKELEIRLARAIRVDELERTEQLGRYVATRADRPNQITGSSPAARDLRARIDWAARAYPKPVLITGETGTGKGLAARAIHALSAAPRERLLHINCAAISESMFEAEMFGHERGVFTGALESRQGFFELADGGTLILDEIGDVPLAMQPKLLRALEDGLVRRVGGQVERSVRLRVIAVTNRDIEAMVSDGIFRRDLYFRLAVLQIIVPPLRNRVEDIPELVEQFLGDLAGYPNHRVSELDLERLKRHDWPGNVRELKNFIERYVVSERRDRELTTIGEISDSSSREGEKQALVEESHFPTIAEMERAHIERALERTSGNRTAAAKLLGISRSTLKRKLAQARLRHADGEETT